MPTRHTIETREFDNPFRTPDEVPGPDAILKLDDQLTTAFNWLLLLSMGFVVFFVVLIISVTVIPIAIFTMMPFAWMFALAVVATSPIIAGFVAIRAVRHVNRRFAKEASA